MNKDVFCWGLMAGPAALAAVILIRGLRRSHPSRSRLIAGLLTGVVVAGLNMLLEFAGAELDIYYVSGPAVIVRTPLPLTVAWVFMTFGFVTGYAAVKRRAAGKGPVMIFIAVGVVAGWLADYTFYRAGILSLGAHGSAAGIAAVWLTFVPLTVFIFELLQAALGSAKSTGT
jgi:hypothetical protein